MSERIELIPGSKATPRSKSMAHRMFFEQEGKLVPVKGAIVSFSEGEKIYATLFTYHLEGPPYTTPQVAPGAAASAGELTSYKAVAINAVHAREQVIAGSVRQAHATSYGPGITILWEKLEEGCPEWKFGQALAGALAEYDAMVESSYSYESWEAAHAAFADRPNSYYEAMRQGEEGVADRALVLAQSRALAKHFGGGPANVEMSLRFRAWKSDHWKSLAKPVLDAQTAKAEEEVAKLSRTEELLKAVSGKLGDLFDGLDQETLNVLGVVLGHEGELATPKKLMEWTQAKGFAFAASAPPKGLFAGPGPDFPFPDSDWVELTPGVVPGGNFAAQSFSHQPVGAQQAEEFFKAFPGLGLPEGAPLGVSFPGYAAPPGMAFAPGPGESFTMGDSAEGLSPRHLDAAVAEADVLRARLHSDANERKRKLGLFKDVVGGSLHWLLEKVEGALPPVPAEPIGPVEQILGRTGVNGSRPGVLSALNEMAGGLDPFEVERLRAPGEGF